MNERLQKLLAQHGVGSRRQVESWIAEGRVLVNGRPAELGQKVGREDRVVVDGRDLTSLLRRVARRRVLLCHKPSGEMSKRGREDDRAGVGERLPSPGAGRWLPVNALAFGEEGLLVLTNDGALAASLGRRARELPLEFMVRVLRPRDPLTGEPAALPDVPREVEHDGRLAGFAEVAPVDTGATNVWFRVRTAGSVPRGAVRALFDAAGLKVSRVMLLRWGPLQLPRDLPRGRSRDASPEELAALLELAGLAAKREAAPRPGRARRPAQRHSKRRPVTPRDSGPSR